MRKWIAELVEIIFLVTLIFLVRTYGFGLYQVPTGSMETTMLVGERFFADKFTYAFLRNPVRGDIIAFNDPTYSYSDNTLKRLVEYYAWGPSNWTKRVIGQPGEHVRGVIEQGKPVIYINDQKIDEPYLNKYPLVAVVKGLDQQGIMQQLDSIARRGFGDYNLERATGHNIVLESYDPKVPFQKQPFYRINPLHIVMNPQTGEPIIRKPGDLIHELIPHSEEGNRFWNGTDEFNVKLREDEYWVMGDNRLGSGDSRVFGPIHRTKTFIHGRILYRIWSVDSNAWFWLFDLIQNPVDFWSRIRWSRFFNKVS